MKKFFRFLCVLLGPLIESLLTGILGALCLFWVCSLFGLFVFFAPSPIWLKWVVGIVDSFCIIMLLYAWISDAYNKIYNQ